MEQDTIGKNCNDAEKARMYVCLCSMQMLGACNFERLSNLRSKENQYVCMFQCACLLAYVLFRDIIHNKKWQTVLEFIPKATNPAPYQYKYEETQF
jgi:hypothetical protein